MSNKVNYSPYKVRNEKPIQLVEVSKQNGKCVGKRVIAFWSDNSRKAYMNAIGYLDGFMRCMTMFGGGANCPKEIEYPCLMQKDGYEFYTHRYFDFHGKNGEDIGSGRAWRLEKKSGKLVTGKDAWGK